MKEPAPIGKLTQFFLFCSGVSVDLIKKCPKFEINKYSSIGLTVLFTTGIAILSSFYAFSLIFESKITSLILGFVWGVLIFNLDRYIISTMRPGKNKLSEFTKSIPRLIIALLIAVVISKPLEIKLFKSEINSFLTLENADKIYTVDQKYSKSFDDLNLRSETLEREYSEQVKLRDKYYEEYKCECDGTCGTQVRGRGEECERKRIKYESFEKELLALRNRIDNSLLKIEVSRESIKQSVLNEKKIISNSFSLGLIDQIRALNNIDKFSSLLILAIFIMIEVAPILTKLLSQKGPYDHLIMEHELQYESNYLRVVDDFKLEREKNKNMKKMSTEMEMKSKQTEIQNILKQEAFERYEKMKKAIDEKISKN